MPTDIDGLIARMRSGGVLERIRAAEALAEHGSPGVVAALAPMLRDGDWRVRWLAAEALGKMGLAAAAEALCGMLAEGDPEDRRSAADALAEMGGPAVGPLCNAARRRDAAGDRAQETLLRIGDPESLPDVVLQDERMPMRERLLALHALRQAGWRGPVRRALERHGGDLSDALEAAVHEAERTARLLRPVAGPVGAARPAVLVRPADAPDAPAED